METPNTRSRKKRELELGSQDEPSVKWECDRKLYRAMLDMTSNETIPIPAPTQKPSLPRISPTASSSYRPRKRPCRNRSLPIGTSSGTPNPESTSGASLSSSAPIGLDSLLRQAMETFHIRSPDTASVRTQTMTQNPQKQKRIAAAQAQAGAMPLRPTVVNQTVVLAERPLSLSSISTIQTRSTPSSKLVTKQIPSTLHSRTPSKPAKPSLSTTRPAAPTNDHINILLSQSHPPTETRGQRGPAPRIGLRSSEDLQPSQANGNGNTRAFRPPLLAVHGVRASPRRHNTTSTSHHPAIAVLGPMRGPIGAPTIPRVSPRRPAPQRLLSEATGARSVAQIMRGAVGRMPVVRLTKMEEKMPSSDSGTGDESFDSFDGIFLGGGAEVEELLRTVDGTH